MRITKIHKFILGIIFGFLIAVYQGYLHCTSFEALLIIFYGSSLLLIKFFDCIIKDSPKP